MLLFAVPNYASVVAPSDFQHTHTTSGARDGSFSGGTRI